MENDLKRYVRRLVMIWLGIETSNTPLSIALVKDGQLLIEENTNVKITHSIQAMATIERLLEKAQIEPNAINAIAISEGPGSYTGVRIGVTIAKTLAWSLKIPLVGVSSLKVLAANEPYFSGAICPIFDARRSSVFTAVYQWKGDQLVTIIEEAHMPIEELLNKLSSLQLPTLFIGKDVQVYKEQIDLQLSEQANYPPFYSDLPRASALIHLAEQQNAESNVHIFVPNYRRVAEAEANWLQQQKAAKHNE